MGKNKQTLYYKVAYDGQFTIDFDELAEIVIDNNRNKLKEELIEEFCSNMDEYFQLLDFFDGQFLTQDQLDMIEEEVIDRINNYM